MRIHRVVVLSACVLAPLGAGCQEDRKAPVEDRFGAAPGAGKADGGEIGLIGDLGFGEAAEVWHEPPPRYLAVRFLAAGGDWLDISLESISGADPVAWLLDEKGEVLAVSDDASAGALDARIQLALPAGIPAAHYLVFRDYFDDPGVYRLALDGASDWPTCGGGGGSLEACPAGFECVGPDVALGGAGACARTCGGFANLACPGGQTCGENPYDSCDPAQHADCTGLCLGD